MSDSYEVRFNRLVHAVDLAVRVWTQDIHDAYAKGGTDFTSAVIMEGHYGEAMDALRALPASPALPPDARERVARALWDASRERHGGVTWDEALGASVGSGVGILRARCLDDAAAILAALGGGA